LRQASNIIEKTFNWIGYVKSEWDKRTATRYHEDEAMSALLRTGKKYYKDPATAYEEHVWTYACVWGIANAAAMLEPKMFDIDSEGNQIEVKDHWLLDLLKYPNDEYTGYDLTEGTFSFLELVGDGYWEIVRSKATERPVHLYLMRSDRVAVVGDEKKLTKGYVYTPNSKNYALSPEDVIHFRNFSPKSEINGQGSIKAATTSLEAEYLATEYFKDFFRRGGIPSFVLEMPHRMSDPSYARLKGALSKKQGIGKQRGELILEEGAKYVQTEVTPKESGEEIATIRSRSAVAASTGVPPIKIQSLEGTAYANARFQDISFWRNTMEPRLKKFYAKITLECLRKAGSTAWLVPDMARVLMNIDEFKNEVTAYNGLVDRGILSRNDVRDKLDFGAVPGGDILTVNPNLVKLSDLTGEEEPEEEEEG